jgi:hypothetical protein
MPVTFWRSVLVGVISTMSMDLLSLAASRLRLIASLSPQVSIAGSSTDLCHTRSRNSRSTFR